MPAVFRLAGQVYGVLLRLYPRPFQADHAAQMRLTFGDAGRAAYQRGGAGWLAAFWLATVLDLFPSALAEWLRLGGLTMLKSRLIALAGPLTILVGALWLAAALGSRALELRLLSDDTAVGFVAIPFFLSLLPLPLAALGAYLRFAPRAGGLGRLGLALSLGGGAAVLVMVGLSFGLGGAAPSVASGAWVNIAALLCFVALRVGYGLFGVAALRGRLLPRGNALPLLLGLTVILALPFEWFGAPALLPGQWSSPVWHFALSGAAWVLLGLALLRPARAPQPAAAA
ncbi:MAG: hypothetical protein IT317_23975 [Anaerolineales bacterium]|nr:hypothetical protein [Anaerolineales bacterium]